jgi:hypothetical protein
MPKVYITNYNPDYDYEAAEQIGETIHMTTGHMPEYKLKGLKEKFDKFAASAERGDFLLLSGSNIVTAIAAISWMEIHPEVVLLQHGKTKNSDGVYQTSYIRYHVTST